VGWGGGGGGGGGVLLLGWCNLALCGGWGGVLGVCGWGDVCFVSNHPWCGGVLWGVGWTLWRTFFGVLFWGVCLFFFVCVLKEKRGGRRRVENSRRELQGFDGTAGLREAERGATRKLPSDSCNSEEEDRKAARGGKGSQSLFSG